MMECRDLTNDVLTEPLSADAREHFERCAACRARRLDLRSLEAGLSALGRALPKSANPALVRRILTRIPKQAPRSGWRWAAGVAPAAALHLVGICAAHKPARPEPSTPRDTVAVPAAPPIEMVLDPVPPPPPAPKPVDPAPAPTPAPPLLPPPPVTPDPVPAPKPVEPDKPAPRPVEAPKPPTPPPATKPARVFLALAAVEGPLELQDGDSWKRIARTAEWDGTAALRSSDKLARFTMPDGTRATLRPRTELRLLSTAPPSLSLERGEAFFDVIPGPNRSFSVVTPDARVQVTGTQFSVKRTDHTEVYVSSGEVRVSNDKGEVNVPAGTATSAKKGATPAKAKAFDSERANAWRRELDGVEVSRFRYDFEDGRLPFPWSTGRVVNFGPARGLNRFSIQGGPGIDCDLTRVDKRVWSVKPGLTLRLRYWTQGAEAIWIQLSCPRTQDNFRYELKYVATGKWETVEIPVASFYRLLDLNSHPQDGDVFSWFNIAVAGAKGDLYFDDIELVEIQK
jgi:hypothetical protein